MRAKLLLLLGLGAVPANAQPSVRPPLPAMGTTLWVQADTYGCGTLEEWSILTTLRQQRRASPAAGLASCVAVAGGTPGTVAGFASEALMTRLVVPLPGRGGVPLWFGSYILGDRPTAAAPG